MKQQNLNSKKFIAYLIADSTWTFTLLAGLFWLKQILEDSNSAAIASQAGLASLLFAIVLVKGFIQAGYIGSQAWLDKYVKIAELAADKIDDDDTEEKIQQ